MRLKDLAHSLGLSLTTVSRALNGYPEVSEATRRRVLRAAAEGNYHPNTRARALAIGRSMSIGHVLSFPNRHLMASPIFAEFIAGASEVYARHGYDLHVLFVPEEKEETAYRDHVARGSVDGFVIHGPRVDDPRIDLLDALGIPFVVHGRATRVATPYSWVDVNNQRAFQRATEILLDLGHRRIGFVNGPERMDFAVRRRAGYLAGLAGRDVGPDPELMVAGEMTERHGCEAARRLLAHPRPPTAFLTSSTLCAYGIRRAADEAGLKLGRDLSVITHDDDLSYFVNGGDRPVFTALRSSVHDAGRRAARMLLGRIADPETPHTSALLEVEFVAGQSTGPGPSLAAAGREVGPAPGAAGRSGAPPRRSATGHRR